MKTVLFAAIATAALATPALAQNGENTGERRTRVMVGAQLVPSYPGADSHQLQPLIGLSRAEAGEQFAYSAADQSFGFDLARDPAIGFGPVVNFVGSRSRGDTDGLLPRVGFSAELGGFAQYEGQNFRLRGELRQGVTGHKALIGTVGADFVSRDADNWLFAIGPRLTWSSGKYHRAYFGVPTAIPAAGLAAYRPGSGIQAVGGTASGLYALSDRWGVSVYGKYDRLVRDAADSPVVRVLGDRNQWSGGAALTFTF